MVISKIVLGHQQIHQTILMVIDEFAFVIFKILVAIETF